MIGPVVSTPMCPSADRKPRRRAEYKKARTRCLPSFVLWFYARPLNAGGADQFIPVLFRIGDEVSIGDIIDERDDPAWYAECVPLRVDRYDIRLSGCQAVE